MPVSAQQQFDRQANQYNDRWAAWSDESLRRMLELASPQADWQAADVATGTGFTALAFAQYVQSVVGVDISPGMLVQARQRAAEKGIVNVSWVEAPAEHLPLPDAAFDLVTVRIAPHHFDDVPQFLREVRRVLKPGGGFVLGDTTVPDSDTFAAEWQNQVERERDPSHHENLSPETWRRLITDAGFTVTDLDHTGGSIAIPLSAWLETAGCDAARQERVRHLFVTAPDAARTQFQIRTDEAGETHFAWQRVILRAVVLQ